MSPAADVVSVGATNKWDVVASFSNSDQYLDLLAPTGDIAVTAGGGTGAGGGTSNAAPHVAGCVALLAEQAANDSVAAIPPASLAGFPLSNRPAIYEAAMKATGLPVTEWRPDPANPGVTPPYSVTTPRLDCGAALWNRHGVNHLATISGTVYDDSSGTPRACGAGWPVEAFSASEPWPPNYAGHPSYGTVTDVNGNYTFNAIPWGVFRLGASPYGIPASPNNAQGNVYWTQVAPVAPIDVNVEPPRP